jgi:hypothetical protein
MIKSSRMRWVGLAARLGRRGMYIEFCCEIRKDKKPVGRTRRMWKDNIRMDVEELGWCEMDLIHLVQDKDR